MLLNPRIGQECVIHYRASADSLPHQNQAGTIRKRSKGRPRNHLVELSGKRMVVVPCGNLFTIGQALRIFKAQAAREES